VALPAVRIQGRDALSGREVIPVVLTPEDMDWGERVGIARNEDAIAMGAVAAFEKDKTLRAHIIGAQAELAFCRLIGVQWEHRDRQWETGLPDVEPLWEVRYSSAWNRVKVRPAPSMKMKGKKRYRYTDNSDLIIAHVSGRAPVFEVYGHIRAEWVQQNRPLEDPGDRDRAAHFTDLYHLAPIDPGFHDLHAWMNVPFLGGWLCMICGIPFDGPLP